MFARDTRTIQFGETNGHEDSVGRSAGVRNYGSKVLYDL